MEKFLRYLDAAFIPIIAIISILIAIADFFGLLGNIFGISNNRIPSLALLLIGLTLPVLARIQHNYNNLHQDVHKALARSATATLRNELDKIDPNLVNLFRSSFLNHLEIFETALNAKRVEIHNTQEYEDLYASTLEGNPGITLWATAFLSEDYLWGSRRLQHAFEQFVKKGGNLKRIILLEESEQLDFPEVQKFLSNQYLMKLRMGQHFQLYTVDTSIMDKRLPLHFVVEPSGRFVWYTVHLIFNNQSKISAVASTNREETQKYIEIFQKLLSNAQEYKPPKVNNL
jgi:hypothetical protein